MEDKRRRSLSPTPRRRQLMEAMMRDEIFDREYQAGRDALNDGIDRLVAGTMQTFRVLAAIQFNAPWRNPRVQSGRAKAA